VEGQRILTQRDDRATEIKEGVRDARTEALGARSGPSCHPAVLIRDSEPESLTERRLSLRVQVRIRDTDMPGGPGGCHWHQIQIQG
jgi:hypothetical protein